MASNWKAKDLSPHAKAVGVDLAALLGYFMTSAPGRANGAEGVTPTFSILCGFPVQNWPAGTLRLPLPLRGRTGASPSSRTPRAGFPYASECTGDGGCTLGELLPRDSSSQL